MKPPHGNKPGGGSRNPPAGGGGRGAGPGGGSRSAPPGGGGRNAPPGSGGRSDRPRSAGGPARSGPPGGDSPRARTEGPRGERPPHSGPRQDGQSFSKRPGPSGPRSPDSGRPRTEGFTPRPRADGAPVRERSDRPELRSEQRPEQRTISDNPRARFDGGPGRAPVDGEAARARRDEGFGPHGGAPRAPRTGAPAPSGTLWIYGTHAVAAALGNPNRLLRRLMLTEEAEATLREKLPGAWPLQPERTERSRMDQLLGTDVVHQGAALLADPLPTPSMEKLLERPGPVLVLDQVADPRNVGAILRSAAAFGAAGVIVQDRNAPDETGALAKAASGALETVPLLRAVNLSRTLVALKAAGCWVVGMDAGGAALSGPALAQRRVVLVVGAEGAGLRRLTRETCDEVAGLKMPGGMESLNVSAATAIALYELTRAS